jgi:general secretion pathway protein D
LTNIDPRKAAEMLRTMLNVRTLYVDDVSSAVLIRDTPETIEMARRLLSSLDVPEAEVMMELEVLEISRGRLEQLGIRYPELVTATPTALAGQALVMADLQYQNSNTLQISNVPVTVDFKRVLSNSNLLASPRIRARNHEKARILIGTRVPVITNTVTATSLQPVVTGSVQYVDAGLTLDVEPTIYRDGDVSMRINLEVSSIIKEVTSAVSGTLAYQMGTRTATTSLRLKNGETQILGGLISDTERGTADRIPGLGDIPLLGRLFGTKKKDGEKTEIVLSITPRIVRPIRGVVDTAAPFWYGMENSLGGGPPVQLPLEIQPMPEQMPLPQVMHEYGKPR